MGEEMIRKVDELGRIVLPVEYRSALGWDVGEKISVSMQDHRLVLQTFRRRCFLCGNEENIVPIHGKCICQTCIDEISEKKGSA